MSAQDFVQSGAMSAEMLDFLADAVRSRLNILICGGTGSGKTTLLNMLSAFIDDSERLITIEDAAALQLRPSHVVRLATRPANLDGARAEIGIASSGERVWALERIVEVSVLFKK